MPVVNWSPDLLGPGRNVPLPLSVVTIPRDQEQLLDREDAWSRKGIPNVPVDVLESVKNFYLQNHKSSSQNQSREEEPAGEPAEESDDEGSVISWEPSPTQHRVGVAPVKESLARTRNPASSPSLTGKELSVVDRPEQAQAQATEPRQKPQARRNLLPDPPMSSLASADEILQVEVPKAIDAASLNPVSKEAGAVSLDPTPPSAQIIIPSTYTDPSQPMPPKPPIRQRLMKDPSKAWGIPDSPKVHSPALTAPPSAIPLTKSNPKLSSSGETRTTTSITSVQAAVNQVHSSSSEAIPPNGRPSQVPYTAFKIAYPDFNAPKNDFIRALLALRHIQKNKSIPRDCYDDFVRIFCGDYLAYIQRDPGDKEEVLSASRFYNWHFGERLYMKGLLTPETLQDAIDQYPSEVAILTTQKPKRTVAKEVINAKAPAALPVQGPTPLPEERVPKTPLIVSSAPVPGPEERPNHIHPEFVPPSPSINAEVEAPTPAIQEKPRTLLATSQASPAPVRREEPRRLSSTHQESATLRREEPKRLSTTRQISPILDLKRDEPKRLSTTRQISPILDLKRDEPKRLSTTRQISPILNSRRDEPRKRTVTHQESPILGSRTEEPRRRSVTCQESPILGSRPDEPGRQSTTRQTPQAPGFKVPALPPAAAAASSAPTQILRADEHRRPEVAPVAAYAKRNSLRAEPLVGTKVPLSQQSTAESMAEDQPKPKKRKTKKDDKGGDAAFARFLEKNYSSTAPEPDSP
ncbi:hypothetical protein V8F20_010757 [Naviculisporaceae sp. PSN 640]